MMIEIDCKKCNRIGWRKFLTLTTAILGTGLVQTTHSSARTIEVTGAEICREAAQFAAATTGIPVTVLHAISLTETGRTKEGRFDPWPWTVNMEGKGIWFQTQASALSYATENYDRGARSFDIGCFQINFKWHGKAFNSIEHMFDPKANAVYAAHYLLTLFEEKGDWNAAVGAYHSRTPKFANKYKKRFARIHAQISGKNELPTTAKVAFKGGNEALRTNRYPLLQSFADANSVRGSLFVSSTTTTGVSLLNQGNGRLF